jgi:NADH:ubiquinone oxidoreductase subunit 3 (subunit A)
MNSRGEAVVARDRRETGTGFMFIATALWVSDLLVIFFFPAAVRLGKYTSFLAVVAALAFLGLALFVKGYEMRSDGE